MKNNNHSNINVNDLKFANKKVKQISVSNFKPEWKLFLNRFFGKKINWILVFTFFILLFFISISAIFYSYSPKLAILDSELSYNLPNYSHKATITKTLEPNSAFLKLLIQLNNKNSNLIISNIQVFDKYEVVYNPYILLNLLTGKNYYLLFGTNELGIDRFSFFIHSFGWTIFITLITCLLQLFLGTFIGTYFGYYSKKTISKINYYLVSTINVIPFLIIIVLIFNLVSYSHIKTIIILSCIGSVNFFYSSYSITINVKNMEYIVAYRSSGLSDFRIIMIILKQNIWKNLPIISESLALNILALASLTFFNVYGIDKYLTIGNVFRNLIDNFENISYTIFVILITSFYILLVKILGINLYIASNPIIKQ
ncbi:ABC transporter permease subunit [Mycoplasmopsis lipofaciens]|uniref:ABC transporter permease subunit n=1 Tax=Mycoplasmopsis lipofaciens TaxID=114884 RepID=UPI000485CA31|nr:ABC transporter permease subunit [Mycoplasmopsis lipofaciens]